MSYCVNCGVKLKNSEKKCPLCNTIVINPNKENVYEPAYSNVIEKFNSINLSYLVKLIMIILFILALVTVVCNIIISKKISWSIYVVSSIIYVSSHLSFLIRKSIFIPLTIELISLELLLFIIAYLNNGMHWYLYLVFPFILVLWVYIILCTYFVKKRKKSLLRNLSICFLFSCVALIVIEGGIDLFNNDIIKLKWSLYASLPIIIISIIMFIISFNKKLLDEIKQRIFV